MEMHNYPPQKQRASMAAQLEDELTVKERPCDGRNLASDAEH